MKYLITFIFCLCNIAYAKNNEITVKPKTGSTFNQFITELNSIGCYYVDSSIVYSTSDLLVTASCPNFTYLNSLGATVKISDIADSNLSTSAQITEMYTKVRQFIESGNYISLKNINFPSKEATFENQTPLFVNRNAGSNTCGLTRYGTGLPGVNNPKSMIFDRDDIKNYIGDTTLIGHNDLSKSNNNQALFDTQQSIEQVFMPNEKSSHSTVVSYIANQFIGQNFLNGKYGAQVSMNQGVDRAINNGVSVIGAPMVDPIVYNPDTIQYVTDILEPFNRAFDSGIFPIHSSGNQANDMTPYDSDKILTVGAYHRDSNGNVIPLVSDADCIAAGVPQGKVDVLMDSSNISFLGYLYTTESSSYAVGQGVGIAQRTKAYFPWMTNSDLMKAFVNSTKVNNNKPTKNACTGYGAFDECKMVDYIKNNLPTCSDDKYTKNQTFSNYANTLYNGYSPLDACQLSYPSEQIKSAIYTGTNVKSYSCRNNVGAEKSVIQLNSAPTNCKTWIPNWQPILPKPTFYFTANAGQQYKDVFAEACIIKGGYVSIVNTTLCSTTPTYTGPQYSLDIWADTNWPGNNAPGQYSAYASGHP
jgi:hypothetical protein